MVDAAFSPADWPVIIQNEILLFASLFFLLGALDEFAVDALYFVARLREGVRTQRVERLELEGAPLAHRICVIVPAWREERVIGATMRHLLRAWPQDGLRLYVGCYVNDAATIAEAERAAHGDPRARVVVSEVPGPTTKADCMNRVYREIVKDERCESVPFGMAVIHDAEDMVDPAALALFDANLARADLLQLPVLPAPQPGSRWVAGHYMDEFAEAHAKAMVVRDRLKAGIPSAGVGCAIERGLLARLDAERGGAGPFDADSLTEDYEIGLRVAEMGARARFLRFRGTDGRLIATRAFFPADMTSAVRQKTRWVCGIALQGWDRMGWGRNPIDGWMRLRDRRGPLAALVLFAAYLLVLLTGVLWVAAQFGLVRPLVLTPLTQALLLVNLASLIWRAGWRGVFTAREYGIAEGLRAILRIPVGNVIAIVSGRRAVWQYAASLRGRHLGWDKTDHRDHPALAQTSLAQTAIVGRNAKG